MSTCSSAAAAEKTVLGRVAIAPRTPPASTVARSSQDPTVAASPRLVERVREQRECAGLALDVGQHRVDEAGLESEPSRTGRPLDRPAKLVARMAPSRCWCSASAVARRGWSAQRP